MVNLPAVDWGKRCNQCGGRVAEISHDRHNHILDAVIAAEVPGCDNLFVHCQGGDNEFDMDGMVVVCDACFVMELSSYLKDPMEVHYGVE
jgi:hypothetical protein